jgi:aspartate/methionine/tyrosine aminotransferase
LEREMEKQGKKMHLVQLNIGNPQILGQKPMTFNREVLAACLHDNMEKNRQIFSKDACDRAEFYLDSINHRGVGAYTDSPGLRSVIKEVKDFIDKRDDVESNMENIYLLNGASEGITIMLRLLIKDDNDGIMIPTPQYPIYSALITRFGGAQVPYYLDESKGWGLTLQELESSYAKAKDNGVNVRGIVVINPGNPTGQVLDEEDLKKVLEFAYEKNIYVLADEVYQKNIYAKKQFCSMRKTLSKMGQPFSDSIELTSFHSLSKGLLGECGLRGGYMELHNTDEFAKAMVYKSKAVSLCSNSIGQIGVGLMTNPPSKDLVSPDVFNLYQKEEQNIFDGLKMRAKLLSEKLNDIEGITCNEVEGAMYAFPRIRFPQKYLDKAKKEKISPDSRYCLDVLEETGIMIVPGSGFGQVEGTHHFRITNLVNSTEEMNEALANLKKFTERLMSEYA